MTCCALTVQPSDDQIGDQIVKVDALLSKWPALTMKRITTPGPGNPFKGLPRCLRWLRALFRHKSGNIISPAERLIAIGGTHYELCDDFLMLTGKRQEVET